MQIKSIRYERLFALERYENRKICLEVSPSNKDSLAKTMIQVDQIAKDMNVAADALDAAEAAYERRIAEVKLPMKVETAKSIKARIDELLKRIEDENSIAEVNKYASELEDLQRRRLLALEAVEHAEKKVRRLKDECKDIMAALENSLHKKLEKAGVR